MKLILACLPIVFLSSCLTQKRCYDKFPVKADTVRIITYKDTIIYRDTIIDITIFGETVYDTAKIPCPPPPPEFIPDTAKAETMLSRAEAWFSYPYIKLKLIQKDTTIVARLDSAIMEATHWRNEYEKIVVVTQVKKPIPAVYKIALWLWAIVAFVVALKYFVRK